MKKLLAGLLLATSLTGCFTTAGAKIGSTLEHDDPEGRENATEIGVLAGAVVDAALLALVITSASSSLGSGPERQGSCFSYGPGEGDGACGNY